MYIVLNIIMFIFLAILIAVNNRKQKKGAVRPLNYLIGKRPIYSKIQRKLKG